MDDAKVAAFEGMVEVTCALLGSCDGDAVLNDDMKIRDFMGRAYDKLLEIALTERVFESAE